MKITDKNGDILQAQFTFKVQNSEIMVTTINSMEDPQIWVIENNKLVKGGFISISSAISWVGAFGMRD